MTFNIKHTDEELLTLLRENAKHVETKTEFCKLNRNLYTTCSRRFGSIGKALELAGITHFKNGYKTKNVKLKWTKEMLVEELSKHANTEGRVSQNAINKKVTDAIKRRYGTWGKGVQELGFKSIQHQFSKEDVVNNFIAGNGRCTIGHNHVLKYFSNVKELFIYVVSNYDVVASGRKVFNKLPLDEINRRMKDIFSNNTNINKRLIKKLDEELLANIEDLFGNLTYYYAEQMKELYVKRGNYANSFSLLGEEFEELVRYLLEDLKFEVHYHKELAGYLPDFIIDNNHIADAKLSYSLANARSVVKKYGSLKEYVVTVIYLIGEDTDRMAGDIHKHRKIHVNHLIKELPFYLQDEYTEKVNELQDRYTEIQEIKSAG